MARCLSMSAKYQIGGKARGPANVSTSSTVLEPRLLFEFDLGDDSSDCKSDPYLGVTDVFEALTTMVRDRAFS